MLDPQNLTIGGLSAAVVGFIIRELWQAHKRRQQSIVERSENQTYLDARDALALAKKLEVLIEELPTAERVNEGLKEQRKELEKMKDGLADTNRIVEGNYREVDARLKFREGGYGPEPITMTHKLSPEMREELKWLNEKTEEPL